MLVINKEPACPCAEATALLNDGALYAKYVSEDGWVQAATDSSGQLFGRAPGDVVGRHVTELLPVGVARERLGLMREVARAGEPVTVVGMLGGQFVRATYRVVASGSSGVRILVTASPVAIVGRSPPSPMRAVDARENDWGALSALSVRELEVLKLIGEGLTAAEIGARLHRSPKTVHWHRCQIGEKLDATSKVDLAALARDAGVGCMTLEEVKTFRGG